MNKIFAYDNCLSGRIRGMVFATLIMCAFSSCCVTGYCQIDTKAEQTSMKENKE